MDLAVSRLMEMFDRLPSMTWCSRMDPGTGQIEWLYLSARAAELYDTTDAELRNNPQLVFEKNLPEDRVRAQQLIEQSLRTGAPFHHVGGLRLRNGQIRWIETHAVFEQNSDDTVTWWGQSFNVTERELLAKELGARSESLAASEAEKEELIERLRHALDELSTPILEVWDDVLAMPIVGVVDSRRAADMAQRLLAEVVRTQASFVVVDLTGVDFIDTTTADHLMRLIRKVEVVGARCVLTGIRARVAETLVELGVDFGPIGALRNLKHGLREALRSARREAPPGRGEAEENPLAPRARCPDKAAGAAPC